MTKRIAVIAMLAIAACGEGDPEEPVSTNPPADEFAPGGTVDLPAVFRDALIGAPAGGTVTWTLNAGSKAVAALDSGLSLTSSGLLTLPDCSFITRGGTFPYSITVTAKSGETVLLSVPITIDERFLGSNVACYILQGETTCRDPNAAGGIVLETGKTVQFYSRVQTTCSTTWSPALPAGACPAGDPAFAFCQ